MSPDASRPVPSRDKTPAPSCLRIPLHLHVTALVLILLAGVTLALGLVASRESHRLVERNVAASFDGTAALAIQELTRFDATARAAAGALARTPLTAASAETDRRAGLGILAAILRTSPGLSAAYIGWPDGDFLLLRPIGAHAERLMAPNGAEWLAQRVRPTGPSFEFLSADLSSVEYRDHVDYAFDPRTRPWYRQATASTDTIVTPPYIFFTTREPGITAAQRSAAGSVAGVDVSVWDLSHRLPADLPVPLAFTAILDRSGDVLAHSDTRTMTDAIEVWMDGLWPFPVDALPPSGVFQSPVLSALATRAADLPDRFSGDIVADGETWRVLLTPLGDGTVFAMAAPLDELLAGPQAIRTRLLILFAAAVALSLPMIWWASRLATWPVRRFANEANTVAQLDFNRPVRYESHVRELADLGDALDGMRTMLASFTAITLSLAEHERADRILTGMLQALMQATAADGGVAWLADRAGQLGQPVIVHGGDDRAALAAIATAIATAQEPLVLPMAADAAGGDCLGIPLRTADGRLIAALAIHRVVAVGAKTADQPFGPQARALAGSTARPAALVLDRLQLLHDQQDNLRQLALLDAAVIRLNDLVMIAKAAPDAADAIPRIVYVNPAFTKLTGYRTEEAIGQPADLLFGPGTQADRRAAIRDAVARGHPVRCDIILHDRQGKPLWLEIDAVPIRDPAGVIRHWVTVARDIRDRKEAEAVVALSQERFRLLAQATSDVIYDHDHRAEKIWWNDSLATLWGHTDRNATTRTDFWADALHPNDRETVLHSLRDAIAAGAPHWSTEYRFRRADGSYAWVLDRASLLYDETGRAVRTIGGLVDITQRRALDEHLRETQKLEALGQLTGGVAHDFNNLLTVILANSELLSKGLSGNDRLHRLAVMSAAAARRGAELTNRLLAFARRQPLAPCRVDLNALVAGMEGLLQRTLDPSILLDIRPAPGLWTCQVDPGQMETSILNLAVNARDAMPEGGRLTIATANLQFGVPFGPAASAAMPSADAVEQTSPDDPDLKGRYVALTVTDDGCGMDATVAASAFDPFFTTKEVGKGTGLGLSMVHGFVHQSHGTVRLTSTPGQGTCVTLLLPALPGP